jgi:hypothetical protein
MLTKFLLMRNQVKISKIFFYEVEFNKPGGMIMPIIVELTYEDDSKEVFKYPAQIWRKTMNVKKIYATEKAIKKFS